MTELQWQRAATHVQIQLHDNGLLRLDVLAPNIIHVRHTRETSISSTASLMIIPQHEADVPWDITESTDELIVTTSALRVVLVKSTGALAWHDISGTLLVQEPVAGGRHLEQITVERMVYDQDATVREERTVDGVRSRAQGGHSVVDRTAWTTRMNLQFSEGEALYGLGQHEDGILNYRGHTQYLYQQNMKVAMPVLVSTRGWGMLWDTNGLSTFHDDEHGSYFWTEIDDEIDFYFVYGPELDQIMAGFRHLTGKPTLFPRWAYGYIQSKERYKTQDEVVEIAAEYRRRQIPIDCIVQDWMTWEGDWWGQKSFDPARFPDPTAMTRALHDMNIRLMLSIWPIIRKGSPNHAEMRDAGFILGDAATYDAFRPEARQLYWKQANEGLFHHGIDAWWCDCTEPFEADWSGTIKPEPWKRVLINTGEAKKYLDPGYISAFSLLHSQGIYEGQRATAPDMRVVNLTRSGFPGQHRYGTITWAGDTAATWDTLRRQIADGLNFCVTGSPKWTLDVGAFFVQKKEQWFWQGDYPNGCDDPGYRELYLRWFQLGVFLPMLRSHGTDTPREVWRFGEPGSVVYDALINWIDLRYRLLPYTYSLAAHETFSDYTMMRLLAFDFRDDPAVFDIADQYMFGPALMVCPITKPIAEGESVASRAVYLPQGTFWYDFWTGERYTGGNTITVESPLETIPLFVRAGSIVPMGPIVQHSGAALDAPWEIRVYAGADGTFTVYEDDGLTNSYETGAYATVPFTWHDATRTLSVGERSGTYPGMTTSRTLNIVAVTPGQGNGTAHVPSEGVRVTYDGTAASITV